MKFLIVLTLSFFTYASSFCQSNAASEEIEMSKEELIELIQSEEQIKNWIEDLKVPGVKIVNENMEFSHASRVLISSEKFRNSIYKDEYTFLDVKNSLEKLNLQLAFWQMINIYPTDKKKVLEYIYFYDQLLPSEEIVIAAFYTYSFFDPKITKIIENKPVVERPDIFEEYLRRTQEIVSYILEFRKLDKK